MLPNNNNYNDLLDIPFNIEREYMRTDIFLHGDKYVIETDLPGINRKDIRIDYENGYLTIGAAKKALKEDINNYLRRERFYGEIKRSFYIGIKNESDIKAIFKDGILEISFPKEEISKNNKGISIQ